MRSSTTTSFTWTNVLDTGVFGSVKSKTETKTVVIPIEITETSSTQEGVQTEKSATAQRLDYGTTVATGSPSPTPTRPIASTQFLKASRAASRLAYAFEYRRPPIILGEGGGGGSGFFGGWMFPKLWMVPVGVEILGVPPEARRSARTRSRTSGKANGEGASAPNKSKQKNQKKGSVQRPKQPPSLIPRNIFPIRF